jgi:hypothetical protein
MQDGGTRSGNEVLTLCYHCVSLERVVTFLACVFEPSSLGLCCACWDFLCSWRHGSGKRCTISFRMREALLYDMRSHYDELITIKSFSTV